MVDLREIHAVQTLPVRRIPENDGTSAADSQHMIVFRIEGNRLATVFALDRTQRFAADTRDRVDNVQMTIDAADP